MPEFPMSAKPSGLLRGAAPFLLAAVLLSAGFWLLLRPTRAAAVEEAEAEASRLAGLVSEVEPGAGGSGLVDVGLGDELARVRERVGALRGILARGTEAEAVLHSLPAIAAEEQVQFRRFAPEPATRLDGYVAEAASVVAEGRYFDFVRLFERLSVLPQLVLIEDVEFRVAGEGRLTSRFVAVTVRQHTPEPTPGEDEFPADEFPDDTGTLVGTGGC